MLERNINQKHLCWHLHMQSEHWKQSFTKNQTDRRQPIRQRQPVLSLNG